MRMVFSSQCIRSSFLKTKFKCIIRTGLGTTEEGGHFQAQVRAGVRWRMAKEKDGGSPGRASPHAAGNYS